MKPQTENPAISGAVVQTTTTRRVLPADSAKERTTPEFWSYIERLTPQDWDRHILYIYRLEDNRNVPMEKCAGHMVGADNSQVPLGDQEQLELAIAQKYGGRIFRLILKRGSERVTETRIYNDHAPKHVTPPILDGAGMGPTVSSMTEASATAQVANKAIDTMAGQDHQAVAIGVSALSAAANVIKSFSDKPNGGGGDDLTRQFMQAMINRMLNPPDPLDQLTKILAVVAQLNPSGAANPQLGKILDVAVEKLLNPPPSGPASSTGAELVRALPTIATYVTQALAHWHAGSEAQRDTALVMQGQPVLSRAVPPGAPAPAANPAPVNSPGPEASAMGVSLEFIESKIIEILHEPVSADEAADQTLEFLARMDGRLVQQLMGLGETGLLGLFNSRPTLKPALQNLPRLQEFIRAFLKFAGENEQRNIAGEIDGGANGAAKAN